MLKYIRGQSKKFEYRVVIHESLVSHFSMKIYEKKLFSHHNLKMIRTLNFFEISRPESTL